MPKWTDEQRQAIYESGTNIIVSAGAGSGKTAVLSERVLEKVKNGIHVDELLILTFTNAAAAEMKDRIRKKIAKDPNLKDELDKVDISYITTFDAYALSLVKKYNHLLNISGNISIIDATIITLEKEKILEETFEEYYQTKKQDFLHLINDFCLKDDKEIFEAIINLNNKLDNCYDKRKILENYLDSYYQDKIIKGFVREYEELILKKKDTLSRLVDNLSYNVDCDYIDKCMEALRDLLAASDYLSIKKNVLVKLPILRNASEEAKEIKKEIGELIKEIEELTKYNSLEEIEESLYKTKDYVETIIEIILELDKRVNAYKQKNDAYEFVDISKMAIKILEDNLSVREELKNSFKEILIDEYQDTNDLQDKFISYIENNNVYMVGDIKQSIYRFRNANPLLFKSKYDSYAVNNGGRKIDLNRNFRSRKEVLDNINLMFNLIMDDAIGGADYINGHQMIFGLEPYNNVNKENYDMEILNYEPLEDKSFTNEEIEIFTIAKDIKDKVNNQYKVMDKETMEERNIDYGDFVILMDRATSFENYKKVFEYLNIPLTIYRDKTISDSIDISILKNIYNLVNLIRNRNFGKEFSYSYMAVARSYLFGLSDREILKTIKDRNYADTEIYAICYRLAKDLDVLNNEEFFDRIVEEFKFEEKIATTNNIDEHLITIDSIRKVVSMTMTAGYTPCTFLDYLKDIANKGIDIKLSLNKESTNAVKIMTIHASKGLEYHVCYFSGLAKKFNIDDLKNKFYYDNTYGFIAPYVNNGIKTTIMKTLLKQKYMEEEISEKLRLFYVALTRAREKMILVTNLEKNELAYKDNGIINNEVRLKYLSFRDMLNSVYDYIKKYMYNIDLESLGLTKDYNLTKVSSSLNNGDVTTKLNVEEISINNELVTNERFSKNISKLQTKEEQTNIKLGLRMHYLLEITDFTNPDYRDFNDFEKNCIMKFINSGILDNAKDIFKEYEFIYEEDNTLKHGFIDLLIIKENSCVIVDYKLKNTQDEAYIKQLNGYKNYVRKITGKDTIIYLYSIIDSKLVNLDKEKASAYY